MNAIDRHQWIHPKDFTQTQTGSWESGWTDAPFPFDELIYCWNARTERRQGFRLFLQVRVAARESPWLYAGFWGDIPLEQEQRNEPEFESGRLELDQLFLKTKADAWRFRVVDHGMNPFLFPPSIQVIITDNTPSQSQLANETQHAFQPEKPVILDIPHRPQIDSGGNRLTNRCQSAALASAMQYFGKWIPLEHIIAYTTDPEYRSFGIWPRTINAAYEFGFDAYIDRFRSWDYVCEALSENKVILCSIRMPKDDSYIAPPYAEIGGHIVALNGITQDGRIVVTDSTRMVGDDGYLLQWWQEDFDKVWMRNKGGVGMVICPPANATRRAVASLPEFPDRTKSAIVKAE